MEEMKTLTTMEEIKAITDPYRIKILNTFYRLGRPATVKQIADEIGEVPAKVHYHVKKLEKLDILIMVKTEEINGILAKYYTPTAKSFDIDGSTCDTTIIKNAVPAFVEALTSILDEGKKQIIEEAGKWNGTKESRLGISLSELELTDEECMEFRELLNKYCIHNSNNGEKKRENTKKYIFLSSIIAVKED